MWLGSFVGDGCGADVAALLLPVLEKAFRRRKRSVGRSWRMDGTQRDEIARSGRIVWNAQRDAPLLNLSRFVFE